ncbi:MAG: glycosyltransferase [Acidimicrobiales bacterium]|nr:glycosyltransferase [Acidimicrobiales bacterium]
MQPLRVAIDATPLLGARTGVGAFTSGLICALAEHEDVRARAYAVTWRGRGDVDGHLPPGVDVVTRPMPARPLRWAWRHGDRPVIELWTGRCDVVHGTNFVVPPTRRAARVVTVHDLTPMRFPELAHRATLDYERLLRRALARGAWVHTVSSFVAAEVVDHFDADPDRVITVPQGVPAVAPADPAEGRRLAGGDRYLLALGTVEPRKDYPALVRAFDEVAAGDQTLRLVVAGPDGWGADAFAAAVAEARHRDRVVRVGYVSDPARAALLRAASVFAYPSRYEGFGLPPLEAMTVGVPVVATDAGSLPEVLGDAALLVPAGDESALAAALGRALEDRRERERLVAAGHRRVATFSWTRSAAGLVDLYRKAASSR